MSAFIALRTAAISVLRRRPIPNLALPILKTSVRGVVRSHPKNTQIPFKVVQVQDADGTLHHPHELERVMQDVNTETHVVRLISQEPPIVRILTILEDKMRKLEAKSVRKVRETKRQILDKEVMMTWHTTGQDLEMKIARIHEELSKGDIRLTIVFNPKPRVPNPKFAAMRDHVWDIVQRITDVGVEWREREFHRSGAKVYLQSTIRKDMKQLPTQFEIEELAKEETKHRERKMSRKAHDSERLVVEAPTFDSEQAKQARREQEEEERRRKEEEEKRRREQEEEERRREEAEERKNKSE